MSSDIVSREVQRAEGYILCHVVSNSLADYLSFLKHNNQAANITTYDAPFLRVSTSYTGNRIQVTINFINSTINCRPRDVK